MVSVSASAKDADKPLAALATLVLFEKDFVMLWKAFNTVKVQELMVTRYAGHEWINTHNDVSALGEKLDNLMVRLNTQYVYTHEGD